MSQGGFARPVAPAAALLALGSVLGGCNSNPVAATDLTFPTASRSLADGRTLTADAGMTSGFTTDRATGATTRHETGFALRRNATGGPEVTVGGRTLDFTPEDLDVLGVAWVRTSDFSQRVMVNSELTGRALTGEGRNFSQIWSYFYENADVRLRGYAAVGNTTPPASLPAMASATYIGGAGMDITSRTDPEDGFGLEWGTVGTAISDRNAEARLTADFVGKTVSGSLTGALRSDGLAYRVAPEHDMVLERTAITGNGFKGAVTGMNVEAGSTYQGRFFGPAAEEAAGVFDIEYGGGTHIGRGFFSVDRQVQ